MLPQEKLLQHEPAVPSSPRRQNKIYTFDQIVADLDAGNFYAPALLVDQILRDERVRGAFEQRVGTLLGKPLSHTPADKTPAAKDVASEIEKLWSTMFPTDTLRQLLEWSLFLGISFAKKHWQKIDGRLVPVHEVWHPSAISWDAQERGYRIRHREGEVLVRMGDPGWLILPRFGFEHAGRRGFVRSVVDSYARRQWNLTDWSRFNETAGKPTPVITAPSTASDAAIESTVKKFSGQGGDAAVGMRKGEKEGWSVALLESTSRAYETFRLALEMLAQDLAVVVLGQWMSTEGQSGLGSNQKAGEPVRIDLQLADAEALTTAIFEQVVKPVVAYNFRDLPPRPLYQVKPPEDLTAKAEQLDKLGDALQKLLPIFGKSLDLGARAAEHGLDLVDGVPIPEYEKPEPIATSDTKSDDYEGEGDALNRVELRARPGRNGQRDIDRLAKRAAVRGAIPVSWNLTKILSAVGGAKDFDEAKIALADALAAMPTDALEDVVTKAQILANLRGRVGVNEE